MLPKKKEKVVYNLQVRYVYSVFLLKLMMFESCT